MIDRVNRYYQLPASEELVHHLRDEIGLTGEYKSIFDELRMTRADTQSHADNVGLPVKTFNYSCSILGKRLITELVRLAEIGLKADRK